MALSELVQTSVIQEFRWFATTFSSAFLRGPAGRLKPVYRPTSQRGLR
ncbi:MAG: hypothetical protein RL701_3568 [Pseudomonadota bacterium]